jgi:hypothetical protein
MELKPLALGEMVDRAASFWRRNWKALFRLFVGFQLVQFVWTKAFELASARWFPVMRGGQETEDLIKSNGPEVLRQVALGLGAMTLLFLFYGLISWFASVASARLAIPLLLGAPASPSRAIAETLRLTGTILGSFFFSLLWCVGLGLVFTLPGIAVALAAFTSETQGMTVLLLVVGMALVGLGWLIALLWYVLRFFLTAQVIALEGLGAVAAIRRSGELIRGRVAPGLLGGMKIRATILISVVTVILLSVSFLAALPQLGLNMIYGGLNSSLGATTIPPLLLVIAQLFQVFAQAVFGSLFAVIGVLFYLDVRVRREGLDLEARVDPDVLRPA